MQKILWTAFSLLLFSICFFLLQKEDSLQNPPLTPSLFEKSRAQKAAFVHVLENQTSPGRQVRVQELGSTSYTLGKSLITLEDGIAYHKRNIVSLSQVFFSPADTAGNDLALVVLSFENSTGIRSYLFVSFSDGSLSSGIALTTNEPIHSAQIKEGVITLTHATRESTSPHISLFALTRKSDEDMINLEPIHSTKEVK